MTAQLSARRTLLWWLVLAACFLPYLFCLDGAPLAEGDEATYAALARDIVDSGRWFDPHLEGRAWFDKPPLTLWLQALSMKVLGVNLMALRLPAVVLAGLSALVIARLGRRFGGVLAGDVAACLFLISPALFSSARDFKFDMVFIFGLVLAFAGLCLAVSAEPTARGRWQAAGLIAAGSSIGFLTKSFAAFALPGLCWLLYVIFSREWRALWRREVVLGFALGLLVCAFYVVPMALRFGAAYVDEQLIWSQVTRFRQNVSRAVNPDSFFYFHTFLWAGLPASLGAYYLFARWLTRSIGQRRTTLSGWPLLCIAWGVAHFVLFGVARSKLPHYIFPVVPASALLCAAHLDALDPRWFRWAARTFCGMVLVTGFLATLLCFPTPLGWLFVAALAFSFVATWRSRGWLELGLVSGGLCAAFYCGPLNQELSRYKLSAVTLDRLRAPAHAQLPALGVMDWNPWALQYHRPVEKVLRVDLEQGIALVKQGGAVLCARPTCERLVEQVAWASMSDPILHFPVQAVTPRFLHRKSRPEELRDYRLVSDTRARGQGN